VLGASVSGVSHRLAGRCSDDAFGWVQPAPGRLALVVADGVGSAGRGAEGAERAVEAVCGFLDEAGTGARERGVGEEMPRPRGQIASGWGPELCAAAIFHASNEIRRVGGENACELATTVVVALLDAATSGRGGFAQVSAGRVGDSIAFSLSDAGEWRELFEGRPVCAGGDATGEEEMLVTATAALPVGDAPDDLVSVQLPPGAALVLVTDGVGVPLRDGPSTVAPMLADVLMRGPTGELGPLGLARALDFSRRGSHDDRTVLAAWALSPERHGR
jgi:hypothetical protein